MQHLFRALILLSLFLVGIPFAHGAELRLQPYAMLEMEGGALAELLKPISIPLGKNGAELGKARQIPLKAWSVGSGHYIEISLELVDAGMELDQASLARAAMAEAYALWRWANPKGIEEKRPARASIYYKGSSSAEMNVLLAEAVFQPTKDNIQNFSFPGPAWKRVEAIHGIDDARVIHYIQLMQLSHYESPSTGEGVTKKEMRARLTPEQDAEISGKMGIEPGTIKLDKMILAPVTQ